MSIATQFGRGAAYYTTHPTVTCPDCGRPADADFRDHGGQCETPIATPRSALGIIRRHALHNGTITANDVRAAMDQAGVPGPSRGPAFAAAEKRGWIVRDGYAPSTDPGTKHHPIATYRSLLYVAERVA